MSQYLFNEHYMELTGLEPVTFSMPLRRATNCAIAPFDDYDDVFRLNSSTAIQISGVWQAIASLDPHHQIKSVSKFTY